MSTLDDRLQQLSRELHATPPPPLGHGCKKLFALDPDYVNLNNGSFGSPPRHVLAAHNIFLMEAERRPDLWMRHNFKPAIHRARSELAELVGCSTDDLVLLTNSTTGVNAVLRGLNGTWSDDGNDAILVYDTTYGACYETAKAIVDTNPLHRLRLVKVNITYPLTDQEFLQRTEQALLEAQRDGIRVRIALLEAIVSLPGVVTPWQEAVKLMRRYNVLSLVDAAHAVGQLELNLKEADPDFFISNCHKWLHTHRGCAFLYAPKRTQHLVPGLPTSFYYLPLSVTAPSNQTSSTPAAPAPGTGGGDASNFISVWETNGTQDVSNFCTVSAALEFRGWLGGEAKIRDYCTTLARTGGRILAQRFGHGARVMEIDSGVALTAHMVNVSVPLEAGRIDRTKFKTQVDVANAITAELWQTYPTYVPFYAHDGEVWVRVSAQVWVEEGDFEWLAVRIVEVVRKLGWAPVDIPPAAL
ncbi:hypothetical protein ACQY0O_006041 [Thecaphora frezii]